MLIPVTSENPEEVSESLKHNRLPPDVSHFMDTLEELLKMLFARF